MAKISHPVLLSSDRIDVGIRNLASDIGRTGPKLWKEEKLEKLKGLIEQFLEEYSSV